jgi:hypothetical protein
VATSQGVLIAYASGDSGTYKSKIWTVGRNNTFTTTYSWEPATPSDPAVVARSFDGGLTWSMADPPFFMGSRVRMWSFPWNNVLIATYRDATSTSLPPANETTVGNAQFSALPYTRFGRHYIAFNYNNGDAASWLRYELPKFAGGGAVITTGTTDDACPAITSMALSPAGMLVCTSRYQGFTYQPAAGGQYPVPWGTVTGAYDRKGYILYRDLAAGLGAPQAADVAASGVSTGVTLRTVTRSPLVIGQWRP